MIVSPEKSIGTKRSQLRLSAFMKRKSTATSAPAIEQSFRLAHERYAALGVDVDRALKALAKIPVSLHCWQGDDVAGFETGGGALGGGLVATGNYPGKPA